VALASTQPLNRNEYHEYLMGGKGGRCVGLTNLPLLCADCLEMCEPQLPGTLRACPGLYRDRQRNELSKVAIMKNQSSYDTCRYEAVPLFWYTEHESKIRPFITETSCTSMSVIPGFHRDVHEICALLGYYAASSGQRLPTFRDNVSVTFSRVEKSKKKREPARRITARRCVISQKSTDLTPYVH
jgi:hypothetical protein